MMMSTPDQSRVIGLPSMGSVRTLPESSFGSPARPNRILIVPCRVSGPESAISPPQVRAIPSPVTVPYEITALMADLRDTWTTPNGDLLTEAVEIWRHMRELALGFWYRWKYPPPDGWMGARQAWKSTPATP